MMKRGLSVFEPPKDLVDTSGVTPKLSEDERVLWIGTSAAQQLFLLNPMDYLGAPCLALFIYHKLYS